MMSFRQRVIRPYITGTKTSPHTGQRITASGNPALDELLGGGIPMNSIILIEEDKFNVYAKVLCKYFLAEGVLQDQEIFLACLDESPEEIFKKLPEPVYNENNAKENSSEEFEQLLMDTTSLRIAWRYNDLPYLHVTDEVRQGEHQFNLQKHMNAKNLTMVQVMFWDGSDVRGCTPKDNNQKTDNPVDEGNQLGEELSAESKAEEETKVEEEVKEPESDMNAEREDVKEPKDKNNEQKDEDQKSEEVPGQKTDKKTPEDLAKSQTSSEVRVMTYAEVSKGMVDDEDQKAQELEVKKEQEEEKKREEEEERKKQDEEEKRRQEVRKSEMRNTARPNNCFFTNQRFPNLIEALMESLRPKGFQRVCIPSLGSPLWYDDNFGKDLLKFLSILRALIQNSNSACFLTIPMHLIAKYDETLVPKIRNLVDYAIELESFAGSDRETNPAFKEYNGLLHFRKMSAINSIALFQHSDLAFKLRRKKFVIEKFHLPPELDIITSEDSEKASNTSAADCCANSGISNDLDF